MVFLQTAFALIGGLADVCPFRPVKAGGSAQGVVVAAAAICPGYQIPAAFCNVKPLFQHILTSKLKAHFLEGNAGVLRAAPGHDAAYGNFNFLFDQMTILARVPCPPARAHSTVWRSLLDAHMYR